MEARLHENGTLSLGTRLPFQIVRSGQANRKSSVEMT